MQITFLGGAGTVTGSKTLLEIDKKKILIDCGLFQGLKELRLKNRRNLPVKANEIPYVLLTHAHLDHCGYIPLLVKQGFQGKILCTPPTRDLTGIILKDSGKIQEEDAERANQYGYTKHHPAKPLYTVEDAIFAMQFFETIDWYQTVELFDKISFQFKNAGHILGSAFIELTANGKTLVFSGDIGRSKPLLLPAKDPVGKADFIVCESTYGDRRHPDTSPVIQLWEALNYTLLNKGGTLLIPTFAVERAQELIYLLSLLKKEKKIPEDIPIYLDSPMGVDVTKVFMKHPAYHTLTEEQIYQMHQTVRLISDFTESMDIVNDNRQKIVLAGSGMSTGGRILYYYNKYLNDSKNTVLLVGYQAEGTRGRSLKEGDNEIKFFGTYHTVKADIMEITSLSAHADQQEILQWLSTIQNKPENLFLNHGEPHQSDALRCKIKYTFNWENVWVAKPDTPYQLF
jgi:metallo-beta-lactamase family protein